LQKAWHENSKRSIDQVKKFAGCWSDMPEELFNKFLEEIKQRRKQAFLNNNQRKI